MDEIKRGDRVRIKKGATVHTLLRGYRVVPRSYVVKVGDVDGPNEYDGVYYPARVIWASSGGYWSYCPMSDVERII